MEQKNDNPFENSELTTILVVSDLGKSKSFYVDMLGAKIFREYGGNSLVLEVLNNWILLVLPGGPTEDKPDIHFQPSADKTQVSHSFTIRVQDCKKSYVLLKSRGVVFITPPYDWGMEILCFFRDPDGHLFEISEFKKTQQ
jgi:catechol 2,3-dioxygenase-like lactoylglutathione lyase family enzyme